MLRMMEQNINQGMTGVVKVYAWGDYVQCINKAWEMYMWGKVCKIHNQ